MLKHFYLFIMVVVTCLPLGAQVTLEECQQAAERNYPLIKQYGLIEKTTQLTVDNIAKGWLPQISATAQATYQSAVAAWPDEMQGMMQGMGVNMKGLTKDQYRVGIDVNQTVFDGGLIRQQKEMARQQGELETAQNDVSLYAVRQRVNEMYFALLLLDEQVRLNEDLQTLLSANEQKLASMYKEGVAMESDYNNVRAERLNAHQQLTSLQSQRKVMAQLLSTFCGIEVDQLQKPPVVSQGLDNKRPELKLIDSQIHLADAQERLLNASLLPKVSLFAQGYYGYPGYNMFEDMLQHRWSLNGMVGARLTWNIGAFYTQKNERNKIRLQRQQAENNREVFLFNNQLEQMQQNENIIRYRQLMTDDAEIVSLRSAVRKAAESKLTHGIIDVNDLVREINQENAAKIQLSMHEIELLKEMYDLKYTLNN